MCENVKTTSLELKVDVSFRLVLLCVSSYQKLGWEEVQLKDCRSVSEKQESLLSSAVSQPRIKVKQRTVVYGKVQSSNSKVYKSEK